MEGRSGAAGAAKKEAKQFVERLHEQPSRRGRRPTAGCPDPHQPRVLAERGRATWVGAAILPASRRGAEGTSSPGATGLGLARAGVLGRGEAQQKNDRAPDAENSFNEAIEFLEPLAGNPDSGSDAPFLLARASYSEAGCTLRTNLTGWKGGERLQRRHRQTDSAPGAISPAGISPGVGSRPRRPGKPAPRQGDSDRRGGTECSPRDPGATDHGYAGPTCDRGTYHRQLAHTLAQLARASKSPDETVRLLRQAVKEQTEAAESSPENQEERKLKASFEAELHRVSTGGSIRP